MQMIERAGDSLVLLLLAAIALLVVVRMYRAVREEDDRAEAEERAAPVGQVTRRLRVVTERDFDDARERMGEDERLAVQRRSEGLGWFDTDEDFQRETA